MVEHHTIVYIPDEKEYGIIVSAGAYASTVRYNAMGIEYQVIMSNEDFIVVEDIIIGIEEEN